MINTKVSTYSEQVNQVEKVKTAEVKALRETIIALARFFSRVSPGAHLPA
jgi:hypothetical protein